MVSIVNQNPPNYVSPFSMILISHFKASLGIFSGEVCVFQLQSRIHQILVQSFSNLFFCRYYQPEFDLLISFYAIRFGDIISHNFLDLRLNSRVLSVSGQLKLPAFMNYYDVIFILSSAITV